MITKEISGKQSIAETFSSGQVVAESLTLKQKLPAGDTGTPWLAHDGESGRDITLLFVPGVLLADAHVMEELRSQVKLNRQLIHPHVLRTHDFIEEEGWAAISSDAVEAETLASLLAKKEHGCFDPSGMQASIVTLCQTLDDAHRAGLLHRDLVPRNILIAKTGEILIANFGISRIILDALGRSSGPGKIDEHLASMSPQQLDGEMPARWDDIYALGALVYQLLTGKPPFFSGDILPQIRKSIPPSISDRRAELGINGEPVPAGWEKVVAACLEKHTTQRPKSAREVGVKLGAEIVLAAPVAVRAETGEAVETKPPREIEEPAKPAEPAARVEMPEENESRESLIDDILWRKPSQHPQPAPGESPSFKHLLEKIPDEQEGKRGFPILKVAVIAACAAGGLWVLFHLPNGKPEQQPAAPLVSATPAATANPKPTPQIAKTEPSQAPAMPSPVASPEKTGSLEQARKAVEELKNAVQGKIQAQQQAQTDLAAAQSALQKQTDAVEAMRKTAGETATLRKQREEEEAKAIADAAKAAADLKAAQDAAAEKAHISADATAAKEKLLNQIKEQEDALQKADGDVQNLQKTAVDKQSAVEAATKAEKAAEDQFQAQQALLAQAEAAAAQQNSPTPSPQPSGISRATPSGTTEPLVPISPEKNPSPASIEAAEQMVLKNITESHQPTPDVTPASGAPALVPSTYVPNPKSQIDQMLTNSLGMKFQPVGDVLFCVWLTRVQDFEVFAKETRFKGTSWLEPGFKQGPDHPVVYVSWNDAAAFCKWLTDKERKTGLLAPNQLYRLPTDLEWSKAAGLPEESGKTPDERDVGIKDVYPWGTQWPPPPGAGNYDGEETGSEVCIKGYDDGYVYTSPVGAFAMNKYGLYDMGGNAWEWCLDWFNGEQKQKVLRGASWYNGDLQLSLLSSCRWPSPPDKSSDNFGFRCVIATEGKAKK